MKLLLVPALIFAAVSLTAADCHSCLDGYCYHRHYIIDGFINPIIDRSTNSLYVTSMLNTYVCDLDTFKSGVNGTVTISQIKYGYSHAVDQKSHSIYVSRKYIPGLFKFDKQTGESHLYALSNEYIDIMYFKDTIYYKSLSDSHIYFLGSINRTPQKVSALDEYILTDYIVDKHDDMYFIVDNENNVYKLKKGADKPVIVASGNNSFTLFSDISDTAVYIGRDTTGVYKLNDGTDRLYLMCVIADRVEQAVCDRDNNIVYSRFRHRNIYHLKRGDEACWINVTANEFSIVVGRKNVDINEIDQSMVNSNYSGISKIVYNLSDDTVLYTNAINDKISESSVNKNLPNVFSQLFKSNLLFLFKCNLNVSISSSAINCV